MWNPFRRDDNAWIEADRRESRLTLFVAVALAAALLGGIAVLVYSLMAS